jgi:DNA repair and recombination protein RAD52
MNGAAREAYSAEEQQRIHALLRKQLGPEYLCKRSGPGGSSLHYIEGWQVTSLANDIFGFNGWSHSIMEMLVDYVRVSQVSRAS